MMDSSTSLPASGSLDALPAGHPQGPRSGRPGLGELYAALAKAQLEIRAASKTQTNPHLKSKYADLASVWDACREPLGKNGLAVVQLTRIADRGLVCIETILGHSSGAEIRSEIVLPVGKPDAQGYGSAITYGRRYALAAIVGVAPEDDDGDGAVRRDSREPKVRHDGDDPMREYAVRLAGADSEQSLNEIAKEIAEARLPPDSATTLQEIYRRRRHELHGPRS